MAANNGNKTCSYDNCKTTAKKCCIGCDSYFCPSHHKQHEQELSVQFEQEVVRFHDTLLDQMSKMDSEITSFSELFNRIEQWRNKTIQAIENAAAAASRKLLDFINKQRTEVQRKLTTITRQIGRTEDELYLEGDIQRFRSELDEVEALQNNLLANHDPKFEIVENREIDWNRVIDVCQVQRQAIVNLPFNARWEQNGITVARRSQSDGANNQLNEPLGIFVDNDNDQTIVICDYGNHHVIQFKKGDANGQVVAGKNGQGNQLDRLSGPTDVLIDKKTNSLIIAELLNRRVIRWSRRPGTTHGKILIDNIKCWGLAMDHQRNLYVSDTEKHEVKRYEIDRGDNIGTVVAGQGKKGSNLSQLDNPRYLFVDSNQALYVSDNNNHRVMKWNNGAREGIVVAGNQGKGKDLTQLAHPNGIFVDASNNLYVAEAFNDRVTRWSRGAQQATIVVGGNGEGSRANQFNGLQGLSLDRDGNLYVVDHRNHRIQRFQLLQ